MSRARSWVPWGDSQSGRHAQAGLLDRSACSWLGCLCGASPEQPPCHPRGRDVSPAALSCTGSGAFAAHWPRPLFTLFLQKEVPGASTGSPAALEKQLRKPDCTSGHQKDFPEDARSPRRRLPHTPATPTLKAPSYPGVGLPPWGQPGVSRFPPPTRFYPPTTSTSGVENVS